MQQNPGTPPGTPPPSTPPGTPPETPPDAPPELSMQEMLAAMQEQMGGMPSIAEGANMSPEMAETRDKQFEHDVRFKFEDIQREVKANIPDATDTMAFDLGMALMKGDITEAINAARTLIKHEMEVDDKDEEQKPLHVEGGASGKSDEDNRQATGLNGIFSKINQAYGGTA